MKNQYFGDINDYKKYGLLRAIIDATDFTVLVNWMLTPNDNGPDGNKTSYLQQPDRFARHDPELFDGLHELVLQEGKRCVGAIEETDLLPGATYFSSVVPDESAGRTKWFDESIDHLSGVQMVFLDPDNGLEVSSKPYGCKFSSKYLYWREVKRLWSAGRSLLIYQHFIREKRDVFVQRMLSALEEATPGSYVEAFSTPHVVFLMALQPDHKRFHNFVCEAVQGRWGIRIKHWDLTQQSKGKCVDTYTVDQVLEALNTHKVRATYSAVAETVGSTPQSLAKEHLGERRPYASWVVSKETGLPTGYLSDDYHPDLLTNLLVIEDAAQLVKVIAGS